MPYRKELAYGDIRGFSCSYRYWKNDSAHEDSPMLHGYALSFAFIFESEDKAVCQEYIETKTTWIKNYVEEIFRNTVIVANDDPLVLDFEALEKAGACDIRFVDRVGASAFAKIMFEDMAPTVLDMTENKVRLRTVKVRENGYYSASFDDLT